MWLPIFNSFFERFLLKLSSAEIKKSVLDVSVANSFIDPLDVNYCIVSFDYSVLDDEAIPYSDRKELSDFVLACKLYKLNYIYVADQSGRLLIKSNTERMKNKDFISKD